jgi:hypothetical protein
MWVLNTLNTFSFSLQTLLVSLIVLKNLQLEFFDFDQAFFNFYSKKDHALKMVFDFFFNNKF